MDTSRDARTTEERLVYMIDCHAATAQYDGTLSTTSRRRAMRLASICTRGAEWAREIGYLAVAERCISAANLLREKHNAD